MRDLRTGVRIGVDVGSVRVGVAASDDRARVVIPVSTMARDEATIAGVAALATERSAVEVVVGLPRSLSDREGPAAAAARAFAGDLALVVAPLPVRLVDERLSTAAAVRELQPTRRPARVRGRRPTGGVGVRHLDSRALRTVVDQQAAVIILTTALDTERATGVPPGERVPAGRDTNGGAR